jgi:DNA mismatch repair protein MSH4
MLRPDASSPAQQSIDARLDVVEELVQSEDMFSEIKEALKTLNKLDLDKLIAAVSIQL